MKCLNCGREMGSAEKCSYCGGSVEKQADKRFDTTIIEGQDFFNQVSKAATKETTDQQFREQQPQPISPAPQAPLQAPPQPVTLNPQQIPGPRQAGPYTQPQAHPPIPMQPRVPSNPPSQQFPERPQPPVTARPVQQIPLRPSSVPSQQQVNLPPQGMPIKPVTQQPPLVHPPQAGAHPQMKSAQAIPIRPASPSSPQVNIPQHGNQPIPLRPVAPPQIQPGTIPSAQQPQRITAQPIPIQPVPMAGSPVRPAQPVPIKPINPVPPLQAGTPNMQGIRPQQAIPQGIHPPASIPAPNIAIPQPAGSPTAARPPIVQSPPPVRPAPMPVQPNPPQPPIKPAAVPFSPENFSPAVMENTEGPVYESGIDIKPVDDSMEVISSGDFIASQEHQFDSPSFGARDNGALPPAFARAREGETDQLFGQNSAAGTTGKGAAGQWKADEFQFAEEERKKGPYISDHKKHSGNEVTYKIITIAITILAFFSLRIIDTLRIGVSNPYDKIFFVRLLIFGFIFSFTGYMFFIKNLGKKESLVKTIILILVIIGFIGSFIGISGISTSADSNFFVAEAGTYYRLLDNPKGQAKNPSFSPNGNMAVMNYAPNNMLENTIHLLKINLDNEDKPGQIVEMPATCNKQMYWYSASEIIFPGLKISPTEPFRFELLDANTSNITTIYSSYEYNFITSYDYNRTEKKIAGAFANLIWILDLDGGQVIPVTGLDILARQYENVPPASDFTLNPAGFLSSLKDNRALIAEMPYLDISPRFAADGKTVYFVRTDPANPNNSNICRVNLENLLGAQTQSGIKTSADLMEYLMNSTEILTTDQTSYGNIAVSPGSRFIASWVRARKGDSPNISMNENALVLFDTNEKTLIRIFPTYPTEAYINQLDWSPDGKYLIADMSSGINSIIIMIEVPSAIVKMDEQAKEK
jgi:WD40 repeat protein